MISSIACMQQCEEKLHRKTQERAVKMMQNRAKLSCFAAAGEMPTAFVDATEA